MQSLRDKLLKAGLINEDQVKKAEKESAAARTQRAAPSQPRAQARPGPASRAQASGGRREGRSEPAVPKLPPLAVPNNKEHQRLEAKRQVELDRSLRELVLGAQLELQVGEQTFYFVTRKNKLRRMQLSKEIAERLEKGELAVVERPDPGQIEHAVVPAQIAEQILRLQERSVRFFNRKEQPVGFLSDEELSRRQEREAAAEASAAAGSEAEGQAEAEPARDPVFTPATDPDEADEVPAEPDQGTDTEAIARSAEHTAKTVVPTPGDEPEE